MTLETPLELSGAPGSPYTRKMLAVLRFRRIPYRLYYRGREPAGYPTAKVPLLPTFYLPDAAGDDAVATALPTPSAGQLLGRTLAEIEQIMIEATIARFGGSVPRAARVLDVSPSTLYRKREAWRSGD